MSTSSRAAILCAVIVVAVGLRLFSFRGYWGTDDGEYGLLANAMVEGRYWSFVDQNYVERFNAPAHLPYRLAIVAPLALAFRTLGVSEVSLVAYPLAVSVLGVVVAFFCARHFFGDRAGLIAAALWTVLPVDVDLATAFFPDGIASFYASVAVLAVLMLSARASSPRTLFAGGLGAGLLFGLSWLSKESVTYLVPFCGFLIVAGLRADRKRTVPLWIGVAIASVSVLAIEMSYYAIARGDFLLRMHENERSFVQTQSYLFYEGSRFGWPEGGSRAEALIKRLFMSGPQVIFFDAQDLFLPFFGVLASAWAFYYRDAAFKVPAVWLFTLVAMYNFFSPSFASYTPLVLLYRYLIPIALPAIVLTAGLLVRLLDSADGVRASDGSERRFWGWALAAALVAICVQTTFGELRDLRRTQPMFETRQTARLVGPSERIYTDPLSRKSLEFYWKYPATTGIVDFEGMSANTIAPGSFVLVDRNRLEWLDVNVSMWLTKDYGYHEPDFWKKAPHSWKVAWENPYATLYQVQP